MIKLQNINFSYNKNKNIFNDVTGEFKDGTFYSITGRSGCGKSTMLSILAGIESINSGHIYFDSNKMSTRDTILQHNISFIFQNFMLFNYMTAIQNVVVAMEIRCEDTINNTQKAIQILSSLGIDREDMNRPVKKLSGGQQQRVAIARAIAVKSKYIFADEPTGNLDEENEIMIINLLKNLAINDNCCVIVVTHSDYVKTVSDFTYNIAKGQMQLV